MSKKLEQVERDLDWMIGRHEAVKFLLNEARKEHDLAVYQLTLERNAAAESSGKWAKRFNDLCAHIRAQPSGHEILKSFGEPAWPPATPPEGGWPQGTYAPGEPSEA